MNDFLAEIFKKIGSKENTKEVEGKDEPNGRLLDGTGH